ncbi:MAG: sugar phosphate isomerase/epimerase [Bacillati bacterium ANGP1]|uniref:Sugar phosphate isomerase/epimerase n=1 Tax=Candidatus Segetimicrobium genomatis TaxID=2569760 RepID=A0A537K1I4_9BACT|nr:MAG: sugar phosphate isomerase/epimerase [Terrabacteria group bacterium ANGP1]
MAYLGLSIRGGERREEELRFARRLGYTAVEISMDGTGLVFGGQLHPQMLREALAAFAKHDFRYSIHSPSSLDLRDRANRENHLALARAALQFCREVGGRVLVIHFEQQSQDPEDEAAFEDAIRRLSDEAGEVLLGIENIEVERVDPVIDCVRRINRPNVVMTLDVGHAYLASVYFRFDVFEAIRSALPFVRHVHVNDNFGRYDPLRLENFTLYRTQTPADTYPLGKGDLHLPVGWGTIPLEKVFGLLRGFRGTVVHEYRYNLFLGSAEDDYARVQNLFAALEDPASGSDKGR